MSRNEADEAVSVVSLSLAQEIYLLDPLSKFSIVNKNILNIPVSEIKRRSFFGLHLTVLIYPNLFAMHVSVVINFNELH